MMVKAGLHPPCHPDSDMAFFDRIYADIGDTQDLSKDVSSFSGHVLNMIALLKDVKSAKGASPTHSLILLDEVGSSTDPIEGAALAETFLGHLCELGCIIVATTHYLSLKMLALRNPHIRNASQEFDIQTLSPTFRLIDGIPGGSSALEIANRLGLDTSIIQEAQSLIQHQDREVHHMFQSLHETRTRLEREVFQAQQLREDAQRLYNETQVTRNLLQIQDQRFRKQWQREFFKAQRQLNQMIEDVKKDKSLSKVQTLQQTIRTINQNILSQLPNNSIDSSDPPHEGDLVEISSLGTTGILLENPKGKKQVSIRVGAQTIKTVPSALRRITHSVPDKSFRTPNQKGEKLIGEANMQTLSSPTVVSPGIGIYQHELDIRGFRLEEAMEMAIAALDQALVNQAKYLKVIHGHGSGILKSAIRKFCQSSSYIQSYRAGDTAEGGDGVTVIELR